MNRTESVPQEWPTSTGEVTTSAVVVRSHLLANPQGITITDIVNRSGMIQYIGEVRRPTDPYLVAVWRVLLDLEESGVAVELNEKWYDLLQLQRKVAKNLHRECMLEDRAYRKALVSDDFSLSDDTKKRREQCSLTSKTTDSQGTYGLSFQTWKRLTQV